MTFISIDQPRVFAVCLVVGIVSGAAYEPFYFLTLFFGKKTIAKHAIKAVWFAACSLIFTAASVIFSLPSFRAYMVLGVGVGLLLYKNSFHKVFAIFISRVYNKTKLIVNKALKALKDKYDGRKEKARSIGSAVGNDNVNYHTCGNYNLSAHRNIFAQERNCKVGRRNCRFASSNRSNGKRNRVVGA